MLRLCWDASVSTDRLTNHIDAAACQRVCVFVFLFLPFCHSKKNRELLLFLFIFTSKGLLIWKIKWITDYSMCETTPNTTEDSHIVILCRYFSSLIRSTTCWTVLSPHQITWITLWARLCDSSQNCTSNYLVFRDLTKQISAYQVCIHGHFQKCSGCYLQGETTLCILNRWVTRASFWRRACVLYQLWILFFFFGLFMSFSPLVSFSLKFWVHTSEFSLH